MADLVPRGRRPGDGRTVTGRHFLQNAVSNAIWDSWPFRDRFPAIQQARVASAKMVPIVQSRLKAGESIDALRAAMATDATLTPQERTAALIELQRTADLHHQQENPDR